MIGCSTTTGTSIRDRSLPFGLSSSSPSASSPGFSSSSAFFFFFFSSFSSSLHSGLSRSSSGCADLGEEWGFGLLGSDPLLSYGEVPRVDFAANETASGANASNSGRPRPHEQI